MVILSCTGCVFRDSPAVEGKWFGRGRGDQLSVYLDQHYTHLNADGSIGRIGMLGRDGGFLLHVVGRGLVRPDSSLHFELFGLAGRQRFEGRLTSADEIDGTITGDRFPSPLRLTLRRGSRRGPY